MSHRALADRERPTRFSSDAADWGPSSFGRGWLSLLLPCNAHTALRNQEQNGREMKVQQENLRSSCLFVWNKMFLLNLQWGWCTADFSTEKCQHRFPKFVWDKKNQNGSNIICSQKIDISITHSCKFNISDWILCLLMVHSGHFMTFQMSLVFVQIRPQTANNCSLQT